MRVNQRVAGSGFIIVAAGMLAAANTSLASSVDFDFACVTANNQANASTSNQYSLTVADDGQMADGSSVVKFVFSNSGPAQSTIGGLYFFGTSSLGRVIGVNGSHENVSFESGRSSGQFADGAATDAPVQNVFLAIGPAGMPNGVRSIGQSVEIAFRLGEGQNFGTVIAALAAGMAGGAGLGGEPFLQIGIDVTNFANGGPESFMLTPIPLPAPVWMGLAGVGVAVLVRRRPGLRVGRA